MVDVYQTALRLLNYRFRGTEELRRKLVQKGLERDEIAAALARLAEEGWLDDARFARELSRSRARKGIGPKRIALELRELGIDAEAAREGMKEAEDDSGGDRLPEIVRKRIRILARRHGEAWLREAEGRKKLLAYLLNQGYEYAAAVAAVDAALEENVEC